MARPRARFLPNRKTGGVGQTDLLVLLLLANAVQLAMVRDGKVLARNLRSERGLSPPRYGAMRCFSSLAGTPA